MAHTTEIIEYKKLSNGQFSITIRCCGNASTDYPHTMAVSLTADERAQSIADARVRVAEQHQQSMDADAAAATLVGEQVTHE